MMNIHRTFQSYLLYFYYIFLYKFVPKYNYLKINFQMILFDNLFLLLFFLFFHFQKYYFFLFLFCYHQNIYDNIIYLYLQY